MCGQFSFKCKMCDQNNVWTGTRKVHMKIYHEWPSKDKDKAISKDHDEENEDEEPRSLSYIKKKKKKDAKRRKDEEKEEKEQKELDLKLKFWIRWNINELVNLDELMRYLPENDLLNILKIMHKPKEESDRKSVV